MHGAADTEQQRRVPVEAQRHLFGLPRPLRPAHERGRTADPQLLVESLLDEEAEAVRRIEPGLFVTEVLERLRVAVASFGADLCGDLDVPRPLEAAALVARHDHFLALAAIHVDGGLAAR